jgi:hypothetical protein
VLGGADTPIWGSTPLDKGTFDIDPTLVAAGSQVLGSVLKPSSAPSSADSVFSTNLNFDNSGWNIAFPGSAITAPVDKTSSQGGAGGLSGNLQSYLPYALVFVGALIAWKALQSKSK